MPIHLKKSENHSKTAVIHSKKREMRKKVRFFTRKRVKKE